MIEQLASSGVCHRELRAEIIAIAKMWIVERWVEHAHAHIKRVVRTCSGHCFPAKIDAELAIDEHLSIID